MNEITPTILSEVIDLIKNDKFESDSEIIQRALEENARNFNSLFQIGIACSQNNRLKEAIIIFNYLRLYKKDDARIPYNLGILHAMRGDYQSALTAYDLALQINPNDVETLVNKGSAFIDAKNYAAALEVLEDAIRVKPDMVEAWSNKGIALNNLKYYKEALVSYNEAIRLNPNYFEAWSNRSVPLNKLKYYKEAFESCDQAIHLKPDYAEAWSNKGNTLHELKRYEEAISHYDQAIRLKPDLNWAYGYLIHLKMMVCSWDNFQENIDVLKHKVQHHDKVITPFPLIALTDNALIQREGAEIFTRSQYPSNPTLGKINSRDNRDKIRIGYFSADFRTHPVSFLTAELFELHDKSKFETIAFSFGLDDQSLIRIRLSKAFSRFIDVSSMSDKEIATLSRDLGIDIAIDLGGFTADSRTAIFAYRAAPIQLSYIGYLGTMSSDYMDYLLADETIIHQGDEQFYSEKIVRLPSYQINDRQRVISNKEFTRQELGLPDQGFVFCCFNNNYKILPATFGSWMNILRATEKSVLFLYAENRWAQANLKKEAEARGIDSQRLIFGEKLSADDYLARYRACDLFLDTSPYNAGTTASDALWAGIPVLTLIGQSFAGRVAASLLNAIGLPELITHTQEEYEALAIELAMNPQKLAAIKLKLANNRLTTALFNTPLFTKNLEAAYREMYQRYQAGLPPEHIHI